MRSLALPLILTLFIAGCTSSSPSGGGPGVAVEVFQPEFSEVYSSEPVNFDFRIKNLGSVDASSVNAVILGLEEWDCQFCNQKIGGSPGGSHVGTDCFTNRLLAGRQELGTSGEVKTCSFSAVAPQVPQGLPVVYQPSVRVTYSYSSSVIKTINVGSQAELRRIENLGAALPAETTSVTSGPVSISINVKGPIRFFGTTFSFPIEIVLSNVGGGTVCKAGTGCANSNEWNILKFTTTIGGESTDCGADKEISLFRGQTNTITCSARISSIPTAGILQKTIQVSASYDYLIDSSTTIKVNPLPSTDSGSPGGAIPAPTGGSRLRTDI